MSDATPAGKELKKAVALSYEDGVDEAPKVVATGSGLVAERIVETAREAGIAIQENPGLVSALAALDLGEHIPAELYPVVAEVLVWVRRMDQEQAGPKKETRGRGSKR